MDTIEYRNKNRYRSYPFVDGSQVLPNDFIIDAGLLTTGVPVLTLVDCKAKQVTIANCGTADIVSGVSEIIAPDGRTAGILVFDNLDILGSQLVYQLDLGFVISCYTQIPVTGVTALVADSQLLRNTITLSAGPGCEIVTEGQNISFNFTYEPQDEDEDLVVQRICVTVEPGPHNWDVQGVLEQGETTGINIKGYNLELEDICGSTSLLPGTGMPLVPSEYLPCEATEDPEDPTPSPGNSFCVVPGLGGVISLTASGDDNPWSVIPRAAGATDKVLDLPEPVLGSQQVAQIVSNYFKTGKGLEAMYIGLKQRDMK